MKWLVAYGMVLLALLALPIAVIVIGSLSAHPLDPVTVTV